MTYTCMEDVRCRSNKIALKLNEATNYGRSPLPPEYRDLDREWRELADVKPADFLKGGVEVVEADNPPTQAESKRNDSPPPHEYDALTVAYCNPRALLKDGLEVVEADIKNNRPKAACSLKRIHINLATNEFCDTVWGR